MIGRVCSGGFLACWLMAGCASAWAQVISADGAALVDEARASAALGQDSIRVVLPLKTEAGEGERATAWLLAPEGAPWGETSIALSRGTRSAEFTLPWPKDEKGHPAAEVGWYRVGYRVAQPGKQPAHGILALGAILRNLLGLSLARSGQPVVGKPYSVRVFAGNPITGEPYRGVVVQGTLSPEATPNAQAGPAAKSVVRAGTTGAGGEAVLTFPIEAEPGASLNLTVIGTMTGSRGIDSGVRGLVSDHAQTRVEQRLNIGDHMKIRVETDKPLHKPGETVHLRALVLDPAGHAAANTKLTLTIDDPQSNKLVEVALTTNRFGIAAYDWKTGAHLASGEYDAGFQPEDASDWEGYGQARLRLERYDLPEFGVRVEMDRGFYLEGETPVARVHAGYLFGKPVAAGTVQLVRASHPLRFGAAGKAELIGQVQQTAELNASGDAELRLEVKDDFDELRTREFEQFRDQNFTVVVTDASTGRSEPQKFTVRLTRSPMNIYLRALGGDRQGGEYRVWAGMADGRPMAAKVTLDWLVDGQPAQRAGVVTTNRYGLAKLSLHAPHLPTSRDEWGTTRGWQIRMTARDAEGRLSQTTDTFWPEQEDTLWVEVAHSLLKPSQAIEGVLHGPAGSLVDLDARAEDGALLAHQQMRMTHAQEPFTVPASGAFHGMVTLDAYSVGGGSGEGSSWSGGPVVYKAVLYPEDRQVRLRLSGLQATYPPGAEVTARLAVRQGAGGPVASAVGVSVFDQAVEQRAASEDEDAVAWWPQGWLRGDSEVSGVTLESLNRTDMSRPVPEDLDLAAESALQFTEMPQVQVEASNDAAGISALRAAMEKAAKPLGSAVLAARPERLPATIEGVRALARAAKLDDALLRDAWGVEYRAKAAVEGNSEAVKLLSAGPDKRFGTADDLEVDLCARLYFALPGERLAGLLQDAVKAGRTLPGSEDALKRLAREGGLDLDKTLDPGGKPYHYQMEMTRRFFRVHVYAHDATQRPDGEFASGEAWSSVGIDSFAATEKRMEAAIRAWEDAGHQFPETVEDARQAFAAAGIGLADLRDPLGGGFTLRTTQVMGYTRIPRVTAGATVESAAKPVTHLLRAIQVLVSAKEKDAAPEVVAQFLHPITEQSGSENKPHAVDGGTFKEDTGAVGGTVTDQTGAVIAGAVVKVKTASDDLMATATAAANGMYLVADLTPGLYTVEIRARGFEGFIVREVFVARYAMTMVDAVLSVGAEAQTVTVEADAVAVNADSNVVSTLVRMTGTSEKAAAQGFTPRLRHVFEETAYWAPSLETDAAGNARLHFTLPDSLTTWKFHALASTLDGRVAVLEKSFRTFQPFFVDLDTPQVLTVGDEIRLPVNLRNYTTQAQALPVTVNAAEWFKLLTPQTVQMSVPANGSAQVVVGLSARGQTEAGPLRMSAANARAGDAVEKTVRVHPDGEPREGSAATLLTGGATALKLELPRNTIPGSVHAELRLYPNLGAHLLHAMKAVLERPYGCGEQTISSTYPSLLYLELLQAGNGDSPQKAQAAAYLQLGYDRLEGYFNTGGGLTYWGHRDEAADPALTAYGIEFLIEAQPYVHVDTARIAGAVNWLLSNQAADGSWKPHYGETNSGLNLYVAAVLARTAASKVAADVFPDKMRASTGKAVERAVAWAATSAAAVHDPYANALRLQLALLAGDGAAANRLRAELAATVEHDRLGAHWSAGGHSPFYGWGRAGTLETTALVLAALDKQDALAREALAYLLRNEDHSGVWMSGQATVRVLQALLPLAVAEMKNAGAAETFSLTVNGAALTGSAAEALRSSEGGPGAPRTVDVSQLLKPGANELMLTGGSTTALASVEAAAGFYVPWEQAAEGTAKTQTGTNYGLDFAYHCNGNGAHAGRAIQCSVEARRFGSRSYGMLLAEVGLPPGADVDRAQLEKLVEEGTVSRYEIEADHIVFYLWAWKAEGTQFNFSFTPRYALRAKAAPSSLADYYNPDLRVVLAPPLFVVEQSPAQ